MKKYIKIISLLSILLLITITMFSCGKKKENKLLMTDNTSVLISDDTSTSTSENLDITTSDTTITSSSTTTSTSTSTSTSSVGHTTTTNTNTQSSTSTQTTTSNTTTTTQVVVTYDITFVNYNDRELTTLKVKEGETPIYNEIPTKEEDETYTYEFIGWDSELVPADSDKTYKATYRSVFKEYEVTFFNDQNQEILYSKYHYGDNILVPEDPEKESTDEYSYIFDGWYTSLEGGTKVTSFGKVENNVNYYAHFNADTTIYSVVWKNGTTTLNTESYKYGETPTYKGDTPTKTSTSAYTYTFSGWSPEIAKVTGNATYEAQFSQEDRYYTYTFYNEYACSTVFQTGKVKYNTLISIPSTKPTMDPSESYTYTFSDWYDKATNKSVRQNSSLLRITKDMKYYPSWTTTNRSYTMTFYTDETHVYTTITQPWGNNISLPTNPTKA